MSNLQSTVDNLTAQFAQSLLQALRGMSIEELVTMTARNSHQEESQASLQAEPIAQRLSKLLKHHPSGLRMEEIRMKLGVDKKALAKSIAEVLSSGQIIKNGQKRATTYFASKK